MRTVQKQGHQLGAAAIMQNRNDRSWTGDTGSGHSGKWSEYRHILMVELTGFANGKYVESVGLGMGVRSGPG